MVQIIIQAIIILAALFTIFLGVGKVIKNWESIKNTLAKWTRREIKVIYVSISYNKDGTATLYLYLCGEETSRFFPGSYDKSHDSYTLAMKNIHYDPSNNDYNSNSDRNWAKWKELYIRPLSGEPFPCLVELIGEYRIRFKFCSDNDEPIIVTDVFNFKNELNECLRKYRIKYNKKATKLTDKWKITDRYPT